MRLNHEESQALLRTARNSIDACLSNQNPDPVQSSSAALNQSAGCFVTIKMKGQLRGCIGNFHSKLPLQHEVVQMAVSAATRDPRFYAMSAADIGRFTLEISVLSPLEKIEDINQIEVGVHGLYLEKGYSRGVLLPQVALEYGWDRLSFLRQTCIKAGLPPDGWQSDQTSIFIFSAQIISEE